MRTETSEAFARLVGCFVAAIEDAVPAAASEDAQSEEAAPTTEATPVANDEPATATDAQPEPTAAPAPSGETLSVDQAVAILGVSRPTIYKLIESGELPASKKGRSWRISAADLFVKVTQRMLPGRMPSSLTR